jgi:hypothetical protein
VSLLTIADSNPILADLLLRNQTLSALIKNSLVYENHFDRSEKVDLHSNRGSGSLGMVS